MKVTPMREAKIHLAGAAPEPALSDRAERSLALNPARSFLVQAPAGSGKTYLLTQRFLRLLSEAEKPEEIVAITFTKAAAAEMRNRILEALESAESEAATDSDPESLPALAARAMARSKQLGWQILDQPSQLRITTIDSFCRSLALQSPLSWGGLLSGLGGKLDPVENPEELYRRAARRTLEALKEQDAAARKPIEALLLWRDNNWKDVEDLIVQMLGQRNRWFQDFVFEREPDWELLRQRLETPFRRAARNRLEVLGRLLDGLDGCREFALELARFACLAPGKLSPHRLAELAELPSCFEAQNGEDEALLLAGAVDAHRDLANFLLTAKSEWRKKGGLNVNNGFPATSDGKAAKERFSEFVENLALESGFLAALSAFQRPMPLGYTEPEWELIRQCFAVLRQAAGQLQVVFAETGSVDFTEVAQIALRILAPENGFPSDFAMRQADSIRHLLIDEFQDTSRNQHELLSRLIAAWPEREGRSCFCVGDPMQSIYGFRDAEVELFERARTHGLEMPRWSDAEPLRFEFVPLRANFRTVPSLVSDLNGHFERIFAEDDGSGVRFSAAEAHRESISSARTELHLAFTQTGKDDDANFLAANTEATRETQLNEIVALVRSKLASAQRIRDVASQNPNDNPEKYRIAVLGRTKNSLIPIAEVLREAGIAFRAIDLVPLRERPEVLDALSLARALLNTADRTAWLGVLRAPWCGLSLAELHLLTSNDDAQISATPVPELLTFRLSELFAQGQLEARVYQAASRVAHVLHTAVETRSSASGRSLGTWLESVWKAIGGNDTVNAEQRQNLRLLWTALDGLPEGELDLLGTGLNAALNKLCAQPDPAASSDFGVQLMTIHKSKGLEFEVVIVPDLEAQTRTSEPAMITWLERGLADPEPGDNDDSLTEFLIAPIQAKGTDAGAAKTWVEGIKREREKQELRRVLYVAATRAREELHLFARPRFRVNQASEVSLCNPGGLLATAWPAFGDEVEARFAGWLSETASPLELDSLAAGASDSNSAGNLVQMPAPAQRAVKPTILRRLPSDYSAPESIRWSASAPANRTSPRRIDSPDSQLSNAEAAFEQVEARAEGGMRSRLLGTAIHSLLERLSDLRRSMDPAQASEALAESLPAVTAEIRSHGLSRAEAERVASEALAVARESANHPLGAWILAPHAEAEAESLWTAAIGSRQYRNLRPDRVFFASAHPDDGDPVWWIIDYKTTHATGVNLADELERQSFLLAHRSKYAAQLAAYSRLLHGLIQKPDSETVHIRTGIFYPRLHILDSWLDSWPDSSADS